MLLGACDLTDLGVDSLSVLPLPCEQCIAHTDASSTCSQPEPSALLLRRHLQLVAARRVGLASSAVLAA